MLEASLLALGYDATAQSNNDNPVGLLSIKIKKGHKTKP